jgi:hypothetical protein
MICNMLCIIYIKQQDSINITEIRIFLVFFRFIQNVYVRQGYFTTLGYYTDFTSANFYSTRTVKCKL